MTVAPNSTWARRFLANLGIVAWPLSAAVAALASKNFLLPEYGTAMVLVLILLAGLAVTAVAASLPSKGGRILIGLTAVMSLDMVCQGLIQMNGLLGTLHITEWPRRIIDVGCLFAATFLVLYLLKAQLNSFVRATGLVLLVLVAIFPHHPTSAGWDRPQKPQAGNLGRVVVHLILDEHIGPAGLRARGSAGEAAAANLENFYEGRGFTIFRNAYAVYPYTRFSIGSILGLDEPDPRSTPTSVLSDRWSRVMPWFIQLKSAGYQLHVFSVGTSWNLCVPGLRGYARACDIVGDYPAVSDTRFHIPTRLADAVVQDLLVVTDRSPFLSVPLQFLKLNREVRGQGPGHGLMAMDQIATEIGTASGDQAWFAHLWFPHEPALVNADCSPRKTPAGIDPWPAYEGQMACTRQGVAKIIQALNDRGALDRAVIIVQGDHGLRPTQPGYDVGRWRAITHSALFAVHAPGLRGDANDCSYDIHALMKAAAVGGLPTPADGVAAEVSDPDFWFENAGPRMPVMKLVNLPINSAGCGETQPFPGALAP